MEVDENWPYKKKATTFIVANENCMKKLYPIRRRFVFELRTFRFYNIQKSVKFVIDNLIPNDFIYVCDKTGIQVVVDIEWDNWEEKDLKSKKDFDFESYDA